MTDELKQEFTRKIAQSNPTELTVVIYDIALAYMDEAQAILDKKEGTGQAADPSLWDATGNIRRCLNELIGSLHYEYQPAGELRQLYVFCLGQLGRVSLDGDDRALANVRGIITKLRDAYAQVAHLNGAGSVMTNSQSVYAGLTYGKGALNENIVGSANRGFLA